MEPYATYIPPESRAPFIRRHGIRAWLTWATVEQACGAPLTFSQRFWRRVLG